MLMTAVPVIMYKHPCWSFQDLRIAAHAMHMGGCRYPNVKLATDAVANVSRSGNRWEGFKVDPPCQIVSRMHPQCPVFDGCIAVCCVFWTADGISPTPNPRIHIEPCRWLRIHVQDDASSMRRTLHIHVVCPGNCTDVVACRSWSTSAPPRRCLTRLTRP